MRNTSDEYTSKLTFLSRALFSKDNTQRGEKKERREREREKKESRRLSDEKKVCKKRRTSDNNLFFGKHLAISGGNTTCLFAKGKREKERERSCFRQRPVLRRKRREKDKTR